MEEILKEIIDILTDKRPQFNISLEPFQDENDRDYLVEILCYKSYCDPKIFRSKLYSKIDDIVLKLRLQPELGQINKKYLRTLIAELKESLNYFTPHEYQETEYKIIKDSIINDLRDPVYTKDIQQSKLPDKFFKVFLEFNQYKYETLTYLIRKLESLESTYPEILPVHIEPSKINTEEQPIEKKKLNINLSVSDIALLFRLLDEEKILKYTYKTDIYKFIANSFKTEKQNEICEASVKNKFLSPDNTSIRNLDILLSNLKQHLKKI